MRAFVDTQVTKDQLLASLTAHHAADHITQGTYWQGNGDGRGCAVGCSIHDFRPGSEGEHGLYEPLFGVPESLARLEDRIFEGLPAEEARDWPLRFARAIRPGADLARVTPALLPRIVERRRGALDGLDETVRGLSVSDELRAQILDATKQAREAMGQVLTVLAGWRDTGEIDARAADAAWRAADAAGSAAAAAWSAAAAGRAAEHDEYRWMADMLIEEIQKAPTN